MAMTDSNPVANFPDTPRGISRRIYNRAATPEVIWADLLAVEHWARAVASEMVLGRGQLLAHLADEGTEELDGDSGWSYRKMADVFGLTPGSARQLAIAGRRGRLRAR